MTRKDSAWERMQEDRQRMQKLGIYIVRQNEPLPVHLSHTFEQVKEFRRFEYEAYTTDASLKPPHRLIWRKETKCRAKRIVETAAMLREETVNEMEWRLGMEELVLFRFRSRSSGKVNSTLASLTSNKFSPDCSGRLWRSDVEAVMRGSGLIATNLEDRRRNRKICKCDPEERVMSLASVGINRIFSSRADEMILYVSSKKEHEKLPATPKLRKRRPDRILGFQHTDEFNNRLDEIACNLQDEAGTDTIRNMIETTVVRHRNKLLLFPFLVIEAKAEDGEGLNACDIQTAFPIWKMLKIQEDLREKTGKSLDYGGPLLWYIAYQGTNWQVSGCYTAERQGKPSYEIRTLWHNSLDEDDGALQILLIIDFIFDWARDVYRPTIISQLRTLSGHQEDTLAALADDDICSLAGDLVTKKVVERRDSIQYPIQTNPEDDFNIEAWGLLDSKLGPGLGVFRPAWIIESVFQCLYVTKHNIKDLLKSIPKGFTANLLANTVEKSLSQNNVLISEGVLSTMEEIWTHKARKQETHGASEGEKLFATIIYHTNISSSWELRRCISCAVFDREALDELWSSKSQKGGRAALLDAKEFSRKNAENLLYGLQRVPTEANLVAAIARRRQQLRKLAGTPSSEQSPTFEFVPSADTSPQRVFVEDDLISLVYNWRKVDSSPEEPPDSYLRFSRHSISLEDTPATPNSTASSYFSDSVSLRHKKYILVHQNKGDTRPVSSFCLYQINPTKEPPSKRELAEALWRACKDDIVYCLGGHNNWRARRKLKPAAPGEPQKVWTMARKWLHAMQPSIPETDNIEASGPEIMRKDKLVGGHRYSSNPAKSKTSCSTFQGLPAINTIRDAVNQTNTALSDSAVSEKPGSRFEKDEDEVLAATLHESTLTYIVEKSFKSIKNLLKSSSSMIVHHASEQPTAQRIKENGSSDTGQLALAIAGKTQPEQNPHTEPKYALTATNADTQAWIYEQNQTSRMTSSRSNSPPWKSGTPSPADSEVTTPPLSITSPSSSTSLVSARPGSSKRPLELKDDENPAGVHKKKARSRYRSQAEIDAKTGRSKKEQNFKR